MNKKHKILIIKTGYSEFLEEENNSNRVSLGDVFRTTLLLHLYKNDHVTWVTDKKAFPLLEGNFYINRLLEYDFTTAEQLKEEKFDTLINLEKVPGICALADRISAWRRYGFRFDSEKGKAEAYDRAFEALAVSANPKLKKENNKSFQELLFDMVGAKWKGEGYILSYQPKTKGIYDVCLNTQIGEKWPTKAWTTEYWDELEERLIKDNLKVTRQDKQNKEILTNIHKYIDWINSCKLIVSNDSLGLYLGPILKKKVLGLFGSTYDKSVYFYEYGKVILPEPIPDCLPCFKSSCERGKNCMKDISQERVYKEIKNMQPI